MGSTIDSLDDIDSLCAILSVLRNGSVTIFTNGYILYDADSPENIYKKIKNSLSINVSLRLLISFDASKLQWQHQKHKGIAETLFKVVNVVNKFREVFDPYKDNIQLVVTDHGADSHNESEKITKSLNDLIALFIPKKPIPLSDWLFLQPSPGPTYATPKAVTQAMIRGRVREEQIWSIQCLYNKMQTSTVPKFFTNGLCNYIPFFDFASGEMSTCPNRTEHPRRVITEENCIEVLLLPFHNPRSRHLFIGNNQQRREAICKQLGFALSIVPTLREEQQVSFQEVEYYLFSNTELMCNIELLFLLEDIILLNDSSRKDFCLNFVPTQLIPYLLDAKILSSYLTYYANYKPCNETAPSSIKSFVDNNDTEGFTKYLNEKINNLTCMQAFEGDLPETEYSRTAEKSTEEHLPTFKDIEELGINFPPKKKLKTCNDNPDVLRFFALPYKERKEKIDSVNNNEKLKKLQAQYSESFKTTEINCLLSHQKNTEESLKTLFENLQLSSNDSEKAAIEKNIRFQEMIRDLLKTELSNRDINYYDYPNTMSLYAIT